MKKTIKRTLALIAAVCILLTVFVMPASAKDDSEIVKSFLRSTVLFDDLTKLVAAVRTNDGGKIFMCVLEIYPDFVSGIKKAMEGEEPSDEASIISKGDVLLLFVLTAAGSAALAAFITYGVMRKKQNKPKQCIANKEE